MTPHADLVARLEELASKNGCLSAAYENCIEQGASQSDMCLTCAAATAAKALAALPPPANPLYEYCPSCRRLGPLFGLTAIRSEETGGRHCIACYGKTESRLLPLWTAPPPPADPPALVALVREWQRAQRGCDIESTASAVADAAKADDALLAYPLPAAPPVTDTPQGWQPIETAPKDGTCIHVWAAEGLSFPTVFWTNHDIEGWHVDDGKRGPFPLRGASPTHWMPLPAAPPQEDQ